MHLIKIISRTYKKKQLFILKYSAMITLSADFIGTETPNMAFYENNKLNVNLTISLKNEMVKFILALFLANDEGKKLFFFKYQVQKVFGARISTTNVHITTNHRIVKY